MPHKVAYNACHGGAALSHIAIMRMIELGSQWALESLAKKEEKFDPYGYDLLGIPRHDPILIQTIEELEPEQTNAIMSLLMIHDLRGNKYIVEEHDGWERVLEPDEVAWTTIE